jgi:hypothetical protein
MMLPPEPVLLLEVLPPEPLPPELLPVVTALLDVGEPEVLVVAPAGESGSSSLHAQTKNVAIRRQPRDKRFMVRGYAQRHVAR